MATLIEKPAIVEAAGNKPKIIREFVGRVNTKTSAASVARMSSPAGWVEPGQTPQFDEYTVVISGSLTVETKAKTFVVKEGQGVITPKGEWVRYSTPNGPCEYVAVCVPAFSPDTVRRDAA